MYKFIALLPMKGHSERVPKKNLRNFNGKPLYHHIMNTLRSCNHINKIVVDTDCEFITADIKENFPETIIIKRDNNLLGDMVSMNLIIGSDISQLEGDYFIQTHSTNPLLKSITIDSAIEKLIDNIETNDSIFAVTELHTRLYNSKGEPLNHNPLVLQRTQDLEPIYEENSNFYIFTREAYNKRKVRIGETPLVYPVKKTEAIDIDCEEDFVIAEAVGRYMEEN